MKGGFGFLKRPKLIGNRNIRCSVLLFFVYLFVCLMLNFDIELKYVGDKPGDSDLLNGFSLFFMDLIGKRGDLRIGFRFEILAIHSDYLNILSE